MPPAGAHTGEEANDAIAKKYTKDAVIGEGTFAVVYRGTAVATKRPIAIKKIKVGKGDFPDGLDMSAVRELKFLHELCHPNIIELVDVFSHKMNLNLVLEYLDSDLEMIIKDKSIVFMPADIKSWMMMTLRGLRHLHKCWILHRDMKPNNLLLASDGQLKIADFGLAREYGEPYRRMTCQVVTLWYRPPELLFGAREYGPGIDMWAAGAIFAELMLRCPFLPGESDMGQLNTIFKALGTPTEEDWPGMTSLPDYLPFKVFPRPRLRDIFTAANSDALDLLERMLIYDPTKRILADDALRHPYFSNRPRPTEPSKLPKQKVRAPPVAIADRPGGDGDGRRAELKRKADVGEVPPNGDLNAKKIARKLFQ